MFGRKLITSLALLFALISVAACGSGDAFGPPPVVRTHTYVLSVGACDFNTFSLSISWVSYDWQADFLKTGQTQSVVSVRNTDTMKTSGCVFHTGDTGYVRMIPKGDLTQYLDVAVTDSISFR